MIKHHTYPITGIWFFFANPSLWKPCWKAIFWNILVTIVAIVGFGFLIVPTIDMLDYYRCPHWLSIITAIVFYLIEISIATVLCCLILMPLVMDQLFDEVLKIKGLQSYVIDRPAPPGATWRITVGSILYGLVQLAFMILTLPLNIIPVLGTVLYCYINGFIFAWGYMMHDHIDFRGMTFKQSWSYTMNQKSKYLSFGVVSYALTMVPLANWLFGFTCAVGAGLWAADDYHKEIKKQQQTQQYSFEGQPPSQYSPNQLPPNQYSPNQPNQTHYPFPSE